MKLKLPARLDLPPDFPVAGGVSGLVETGKGQKQWWYDVRRVLQAAIEELRGGGTKGDTGAQGPQGLPGTTTIITTAVMQIDGGEPDSVYDSNTVVDGGSP